MAGVGHRYERGVTPCSGLDVRSASDRIADGFGRFLCFHSVAGSNHRFMIRFVEPQSERQTEFSSSTEYRNSHKNRSFSGARNNAAVLLSVSSQGKPRIKAAGVREVFPITSPAAAAKASTAA